MATRDIINNISRDQVLDPVVISTDTNTTTTDMQGFESLCMSVLMGDSGDTLSGSVFHELILQHGDLADGSDGAAVADTDVVLGEGGSISSGVFALIDAPAEDSAVFSIGYVGKKRYVRVVIDTTGTHTNGTPMGVVALKGKPTLLPVSS